MVPHHLERRRQPGEDSAAVVLDARCFAVHDTLGTDDASTVRFADGLMTEADAEDGNRASPATDCVDGDPRLRRSARSGGQHDGVRGELADFIDGDRVVATHVDVRTELPEVLHEVVGEGVVVVDDEQHRGGSWQVAGAGGWGGDRSPATCNQQLSSRVILLMNRP